MNSIISHAANGQMDGTPHYGTALYDQIKTSIADYSKTSESEKFILNRGFEFTSEEELNAAYDRCQKARHGTLISKEEFLAEAKATASTLAAETYHILVKLVEQQALSPSDVYRYAHFGWCLSSPDAVVAYMTGPHNHWTVNNCDTPTTEDRAKLEVCEEWGFEASRIKIIG